MNHTSSPRDNKNMMIVELESQRNQIDEIASNQLPRFKVSNSIERPNIISNKKGTSNLEAIIIDLNNEIGVTHKDQKEFTKRMKKQ